MIKTINKTTKIHIENHKNHINTQKHIKQTLQKP